MKKSDFELYTFQFSTNNYIVSSKVLFHLFSSEVWFVFGSDIKMYDNLLVDLKVSKSTCDFCSVGFSDMAGLVCAPPSCVLLTYQYKSTGRANSKKILEPLCFVGYSTVGSC